MFTREHFEQVASVLSAARNSDSAPATAAAYGSETESIVHAELGKLIDKLTGQFADVFAESNEHFARKAFIGACNAASRSEIRRLVSASNVRTTEERVNKKTRELSKEVGKLVRV